MKERKRKQKNMIIGGLVAIVFLLSVGYAAFATNLNITGTSNITNSWSVLITNITSKDIVGGATNKSATYTDLTANFSCELVQPGDSITYEITVENRGTLDAVLSNITDNSTSNQYIEVTYPDLNEQEKLYVGQSKKVKAVVTFKDQAIESLNGQQIANISLTLNYTQATAMVDNRSITLSYDTWGGDEIDPIQTNLRSAVVLQTPIRLGYGFKGWYTNKNGAGKKIIDGDYVMKIYEAQNKTDEDTEVTIYAKWTQKTYIIHFNSQGGSPFSDKKNVTWSASNLVKSKTPGREAYEFLGWYTSPNGQGLLVENSTKFSAVMEHLYGAGIDEGPNGSTEITLYANWHLLEFTITYDSQGGSEVPSRIVNWTSTGFADATPTKSGYTFDGWYTESGKLVTNDTIFRTIAASDTIEGLTLYAHWIEN